MTAKTKVYFTATTSGYGSVKEDSLELLRAKLLSFEPDEDRTYQIFQHVETVGLVEDFTVPKFIPPFMSQDGMVDWIIEQNCGTVHGRDLDTPEQFEFLTSAEKAQVKAKVWEHLSTCSDCGVIGTHEELSYADGDDCCSSCADRRDEDEFEENSSECPICLSVVHNFDFVFADDGQHVCENCVDDVNEKYQEQLDMEEEENDNEDRD